MDEATGEELAHDVRPRAREQRRVAGLDEFDFRFRNSALTVMHDTLSALAAAAAHASSRA